MPFDGRSFKDYILRRTTRPGSPELNGLGQPYDKDAYTQGLKIWDQIPELFGGWVSGDGAIKASVFSNLEEWLIQYKLPDGNFRCMILGKINKIEED